MRLLLVAKLSSQARRTTSDEEKPITFTTKDMAWISYPHDDVMVIIAMIGNYNIQRILIDTGSSVDILYATTYD